jgi:hypothetical protein
MDEKKIEINIKGEGVTPGNIRARDLADLLVSSEEMFASVILSQQPNITRDEIVIGLVGIYSGTVRLEFAPQSAEVTFAAADRIAQAFTENNLRSLPLASLENMKTITSFAKKRNCDIEFTSRNGQSISLMTFHPETIIDLPPDIHGETVIYGKLVRIGGRDPTAMIELTDNEQITCDILDQEVAKTLAPRLYNWIGLKGEAKWNSGDFSLQSFRITGITEYEDSSILETFRELRDLIGEYFKDIEDPDDYVRKLRSGDDE